MTIVLEVDPGKRIPLHAHSAEETIIVLHSSAIAIAGKGAGPFSRHFESGSEGGRSVNLHLTTSRSGSRVALANRIRLGSRATRPGRSRPLRQHEEEATGAPRRGSSSPSPLPLLC